MTFGQPGTCLLALILVAMLPSQEHQRPSKKRGIIRRPLSSTTSGEAPTLPKDHINKSDVTSLPAPDHGQTSTTNRSLSLLWHGFEQLLKRIGPCLGGTPAKVPVTVLNTIIDIGKVCPHLAESKQSLNATTNVVGCCGQQKCSGRTSSSNHEPPQRRE